MTCISRQFIRSFYRVKIKMITYFCFKCLFQEVNQALSAEKEWRHRVRLKICIWRRHLRFLLDVDFDRALLCFETGNIWHKGIYSQTQPLLYYCSNGVILNWVEDIFLKLTENDGAVIAIIKLLLFFIIILRNLLLIIEI